MQLFPPPAEKHQHTKTHEWRSREEAFAAHVLNPPNLLRIMRGEVKTPPTLLRINGGKEKKRWESPPPLSKKKRQGKKAPFPRKNRKDILPPPGPPRSGDKSGCVFEKKKRPKHTKREFKYSRNDRGCEKKAKKNIYIYTPDKNFSSPPLSPPSPHCLGSTPV